MGRILAIDYGLKRTGIAVTDPLQIIANGLDTVPSHQLLSFLANYIAKEPVDEMVIGMPKNLDNTDTDSTQAVRQVVKQIQKKFPTVPLILHDERFTSQMAMKAMIDGGMSKKDRRVKATVDRVSATIILQSYMESK
ncbi:Holliday junction resolvase RuvX [Aquirufa rosea]|uniref:Putative pre-16S rRNA nuclease n=1 Tax=Aquirufa rosea TaxID=2509241 RepID=A0A4Q1C1C0_9BACT|nr:Holliday junction resolvase RuvX [Aquirufa rosea]RXK50945.1 Holliday junction resolvase RuvX [Aquirufa rosea]